MKRTKNLVKITAPLPITRIKNIIMIGNGTSGVEHHQEVLTKDMKREIEEDRRDSLVHDLHRTIDREGTGMIEPGNILEINIMIEIIDIEMNQKLEEIERIVNITVRHRNTVSEKNIGCVIMRDTIDQEDIVMDHLLDIAMIVTQIIIMNEDDTPTDLEDQENVAEAEIDQILQDGTNAKKESLANQLKRKFILTSRKSPDMLKTTMYFGMDFNGSISKITFRISKTLINHLLIYSREMVTT